MVQSIEFFPLVTITLAHGYFASAVADPVSVVPTPACADLLERHNCQVEIMPGRTVVWYGRINGRVPARALAQEPNLTFQMISTDPQMPIVTQPDWVGTDTTQTMESCLFFSNKYDLGSADLTVPSAQAYPLTASPPLFSLDGAYPQGERVRVVSWWRNDVVQSFAVQTPGRVDCDLSNLPDARYYVAAGTGDSQDMFVSRQPARVLFGALEYSVGGVHWSADQTAQAHAVTVRFQARETRWSYLITARNPKLPLDQISIDDQLGTVDFDRAPVRLSDGTPAVQLTARTLLPLQEIGPRPPRFLLNIPDFDAHVAHPISLPIAAPDNTRSNGPDSPAHSEIYVQL